MKLDQFVIGFAIFSLFIVGLTYIAADINKNYDVDVSTDDFNDTYNTIDDIYDISESMREATLEADIEGGEATTDSTIKGSYTALRYVKDTFRLVSAITSDIAQTLRIPVFFFNFALVIIVLAVVFAFIYLFLRVRS